jgi:hypothetical protein
VWIATVAIAAIGLAAVAFLGNGSDLETATEESVALPTQNEPLAREGEPTEPGPSAADELDIENITNAPDTSFKSLDGRHTFRVPRPGDPEWEDYLEMRRHPEYASMVQNSAGYAPPYDPEWRASIEGKRKAEPVGLELHGGFSSLRDLAEAVMKELREKDAEGLQELRIRKEEFEIVCWPSFPQSRPYLKIPVAEAWGFHFASSRSGGLQGLRSFGGRSLALEGLGYADIVDYDNFKLFNDLEIIAVDEDTNDRIELSFVQSAIERNGVFKVFMYED